MNKSGPKLPSAPAKRFDSLTDLDDPGELDEVEIVERAPDTARPDFEPAKFAADVETEAERMTQPPSPTYDMLRDSCKSAVAQEVPLDEEQILRPSSARHRIATKIVK